MGTATLGMIVARTVRRNRNTTMMTRKMEINRVVSMSFTDARTTTVRSIATVRVMAGEMEDCRIWQDRANAIHGVNNVGARLAENRDQDAGLAIGQADVANIGNRIEDVAYIADADRPTVVIGDDQRPVFVGFEKLVVIVEYMGCPPV